MEVIKRSGIKERVSFDKITERLNLQIQGRVDALNRFQCSPLDASIDPILIAKDTIAGLYDGVTTRQLDLLSADICANKIHHHPDYNYLAARISISNLQKSTSEGYFGIVCRLYDEKLVSSEFFNFVKDNVDEIDKIFDYSRDFRFDFFGFKTLERAYLLKIGKEIVERPQHLWMRVAIQIHAFTHNSLQEILKNIKMTYDGMSQGYFTHATPTLFNSGTPKNNLSSCFLLNVEDSTENMYHVLSNIAKISKNAGGIGITLSNIRGKESIIHSTQGSSNGIIPYCKVLESVARHINQGSKRLGSIAVYLEPWHSDIYDFVDLRKNTGDENLRARDLFLALWVPDLFMKRVESDSMWSLMCPHECPGLTTVYGDEFETLYLKYESEKRHKKQVKARDLWNHILENQIETGMPYMSYKDNVNHKSNQKNLGTIQSSNLCVAPDTQIMTPQGYYPIKSLRDQSINIWNGEQWSSVLIKKTGNNQELVRVHFSNGEYLDCTPYHHFHIQGEDNVVQAGHLVPGMNIISFKYPQRENYNETTFSNLIHRLEQYIEQYHTSYIDNMNKTENYVLISCKDSLVNRSIRHCITMLGSDAEILEYGVKINYRQLALLKSNDVLQRISRFHRIVPILSLSNSIEENIKIVRVESLIETRDTYCFTEQYRHMGLFNGVLTGNCNEIVEYTSTTETSVCSLASLCLGQYIENGTVNFDKLGEMTQIVVENLNHVIEGSYYPIQETINSHFKHRPIGLGVQGLADVFCKLGLPFESSDAHNLNRQIFEIIYYNALLKSNELAKKFGSYSSFEGSPFSKGQLQWHLWGLTEDKLFLGKDKWDVLIEDIKKYGTRNSLLTALMPTASTSQIMKGNECFEPFTSNLYLRKTLAGEYIVINEYLVRDLIRLGLWSKSMYEEILYFNGSVQKIKEIPQDIKDLYKTAFEIRQIEILKHAVERGPFIDQTQSMNLFMDKPDFSKLSSAHFYGWKNGLKTGMYYLRSQPAVDPIKFGIDVSSIERIKQKYSKSEACVWVRRGQPIPEGCEVCSA